MKTGINIVDDYFDSLSVKTAAGYLATLFFLLVTFSMQHFGAVNHVETFDLGYCLSGVFMMVVFIIALITNIANTKNTAGNIIILLFTVAEILALVFFPFVFVYGETIYLFRIISLLYTFFVAAAILVENAPGFSPIIGRTRRNCTV